MHNEAVIRQLEQQINDDKDEFEFLLEFYPDLPGNNFSFCIGHKMTLKGIGQYVNDTDCDGFNEMVSNHTKCFGRRRQSQGGKEFSKETLEPVLVAGLEKEFENLNVPFQISYHLNVNGM